MHRSL